MLLHKQFGKIKTTIKPQNELFLTRKAMQKVISYKLQRQIYAGSAFLANIKENPL